MNPLRHCFRQRCALAAIAAIASFVAVSALGSRVARADCQAATAKIRWTYPDDTTTSVPPNAVFWLVAETGTLDVRVDGVPLTALGESGVERNQFVPNAPLTEGPHELLARASDYLRGPDSAILSRDVRRLTFQVVAEPERVAEVSIRSVTVYPFIFNYNDGKIISPPEDKYDKECTELATELGWSCDDIILGSVTRIGYEGSGDAIAYLVQAGSVVPALVPAGCASYWRSEYSIGSDYRVAPVLPTGLGEESVFTGSVEVLTTEEAAPGLYSHPSACSFGFGGSAPNALAAAAGLAWAAAQLRRRR